METVRKIYSEIPISEQIPPKIFFLMEWYMKKKGIFFILIVVAGVFFASPVFAQMSKNDLQKMYVDYLRQEGYLPSIDSDGDIVFKIAGDNYLIIIDEDDLQFFQVIEYISLGSTSSQTALNAANYATRRTKVAKAFISSDGKTVCIKVELLLGKPDDFKQFFSRALSMIRSAEESFISQIK
jgi:hypothetical protein